MKDRTITPEKPVRLSIPMLSILGRCEAWIIPRPGCASHPYAIAFYVPQHMTRELMQSALAEVPAQEVPRNGKPLRVL